MAEHSFFEYQRLVQKEAEPELIIQLTNRPEELEDFRPPLIESEDASTQKDIEISVTVAFAIEQPRCGMFFHGKYGCTDNQVSILDPRSMSPPCSQQPNHAIRFCYHTSSVLMMLDTVLALATSDYSSIMHALLIHC